MSDAFQLEQLLRAYRFNLMYAENLVSDLDSNQMYQSFGNGLENSPAFTLGHLSTASALILKYLGAEYPFDATWDEQFRRKGPGDPRRPELDPGTGPSKEVLVTKLQQSHADVETILKGLPTVRFSEPVEWRFDRFFPTLSDLLTFMCISHEAMHLAQVAAWRRAAGLESSLGRL